MHSCNHTPVNSVWVSWLFLVMEIWEFRLKIVYRIATALRKVTFQSNFSHFHSKITKHFQVKFNLTHFLIQSIIRNGLVIIYDSEWNERQLSSATVNGSNDLQTDRCWVYDFFVNDLSVTSYGRLWPFPSCWILFWTSRVFVSPLKVTFFEVLVLD